MSRFNTSTTYPLIPNAQQYMFEKQYVSIQSDDRNMIKYPNASEFEIELPQDYLNVQGVRLISGRFPFVLYTFSQAKKNVTMTFKFTDIYNPGAHSFSDALQEAIFATLYNYMENFIIVIEDGYYNTPEEMARELTNRFNAAVTNLLVSDASSLSLAQKTTLLSGGGYTEFIIVYNIVSRKLWFGNKSSGFELTNIDTATMEENVVQCTRNALPDFGNWGLPGFLGLSRCNEDSIVALDGNVTRFYYGDVFPGDNGYWLIPNSALPGATAFYIQAPLQINLRPPTYFYMEIRGLNMIDETAPYNFSNFTVQTNQTNGIVKSAFAKIPINVEEQNFQWFETMDCYKIFNPPAERIRKLYIKLRYHDGSLIEFFNANYTFMLEFTLFRPQNQKAYNMYTPESIANSNS